MRNKIVTIPELLSIREGWGNKTIVLTNGCFDLLHIGHIRGLEYAKSLGDILIVCVNSDNSIKRIKGEKRPIVFQDDRLEMLSYFPFIDYLIMFDEDSPENVIKNVCPNIFCKGAEYSSPNNPLLERELIREIGGKIEFIPMIKGCSTTNIIKKIIQAYGNT